MKVRVPVLILQAVSLCISGIDYVNNNEVGLPYAECKLSKVSLFCKSTIPEHIPDGVTKVYIEEYSNIVIISNMFHGNHWQNISSLTISCLAPTHVTVMSDAFRVLTNITDLGLHGDFLIFKKYAFRGITDLLTLDLSGCRNVNIDMLLQILNGTEQIRHIKTLDISQISQYSQAFKINEDFSKTTGSKAISTIIARDIAFSVIDFSSIAKYLCHSLEHLDLSFSFVAGWIPFHGLCSSLKRLDIDGMATGIILPFAVPENSQISMNLTGENMLMLLLNVQTLSAINIFTRFPILKNVTINSLTNVSINTKNAILSNNRLRYIDMRVINIHNQIEYLDLSSNGMIFLQLQQMFGKCWLQEIDLSDNSLHEMAEHNSTLFKILFKNCSLLEKVNMSYNSLTDLPEAMFTYNRYLRVIDLSNNKLEQVHFNLDNNHGLLELNLKGNNIASLSGSSINKLSTQLSHENKFKIDLRKNPLICNTCNNKGYTSWIVKNRKNILTDGCVGEHETKQIDESTVKNIEQICNRKARIIYITTLTAGCAVVLVSISTLAFRLRKNIKKKYKHRKIVEEFQNGDGHFEFPVFLAYCGDDEEFVYTNVIPPLTGHLRELIGVDRELICTGDRHFKLGHTIAEQTSYCYDRVSVVILVVSHEFCASHYCTFEAHIAITMGKPIILMFKDLVTSEEMPSTMKVIFKQNTRITWKKHGDEYVMPTTWQNVCQSILDLTHSKSAETKEKNDTVTVDI